MENDVDLPVLNELRREEDKDLRKHAKYLRSCKESLWKRWRREYLTALRERHSLVHKTAKQQFQVDDAVIVCTDDKNRGKWPMAIVLKLYPGSDGQTRGVHLKTKNGTIERPVQHLYRLELQCDVKEEKPNARIQLNPDARDFCPKRAAAKEPTREDKQNSTNVRR